MTSALLACFATLAVAQPSPDPQRSADNIRAHMGFLASDLLEGREAGTRGYDIAAAYAAAEFAKLGLRPAGDAGGFFQRVPLVAYRPVDSGRLRLTGRRGRARPLVFGIDYVPGRNPLADETSVEAPVVFVGYGMSAPERDRDDYRGLDVRGKIVVVLEGAPRDLPAEERAYYASQRTKRREAALRGAVGVVQLTTPSAEKRSPFSRDVAAARGWSMTWADAAGRPFAPAEEAPLLATLSLGGGRKLMADGPAEFDAIMAAAEAPAGDPPRFELAGRLSAAYRTAIRRTESRNVAALLEGSDPALKGETVVLTAHLDHVGMRERGEGDRISNGAIDNAAGVATTFEAARAFVESGARPRRSVLFLLVTAEEVGLVGAEYFARNPTLPPGSLVANVNLDMPVLLYDFTDVIALGAERSGIGPAVRRAAGRVGVGLSPDPLPDEGLFTRSDHFRFVEAGVPAVSLMTGFANGGEAKFTEFLRTRYHRPNDDLSQPIDYAAGAKFARLNYEIARELADADARPSWNPGDFFGTKFASQRQP